MGRTEILQSAGTDYTSVSRGSSTGDHRILGLLTFYFNVLRASVLVNKAEVTSYDLSPKSHRASFITVLYQLQQP